MGNVYLADPVEACSALTTITIDDTEKAGSGISPIVVVKYGSCFPITKVKYA